MTNEKTLIASASLMLIGGGLILVGHLVNRKHEAKINKFNAERAAEHKKTIQDMDAVITHLDERLEKARFWAIVTQPEE